MEDLYKTKTNVCACFVFFFQTYHSLHEVLVSFGRRVLCYPLYRHFSLITTAVQDAAHIFQSGEFSCSVSSSPSVSLSPQQDCVTMRPLSGFQTAPEVKSWVRTSLESAFLPPFILLCGPNKSWTALLSYWRRICPLAGRKKSTVLFFFFKQDWWNWMKECLCTLTSQAQRQHGEWREETVRTERAEICPCPAECDG